jgi:hypothetical protein
LGKAGLPENDGMKKMKTYKYFYQFILVTQLGIFAVCSPLLAGGKKSPMKFPIPELIGATSAQFSLGKELTHISFALNLPTGP